VTSFKEPSLTKKLRQGDNLFTDAKFKESKPRTSGEKKKGGKK
jgi:hypothetical protein